MESGLTGRACCSAGILVALALPTVRPAAAQTPSAAAPPAQQSQPEAAPTGFWERSNLFGDFGGLRPFLDRFGASFGLSEISEVLGNPAGGRAQGAIYEGLTEISLGIDLDRAIGLPNGVFNVSALQIHGRGLTENDLGNLDIASGIEADRSTRLNELWYQQGFFGGKLDVKVGQQSVDLEFMISQYAALFINSSFGWATLPAVDLPSGGPAYPLPTPGVRLRAQPTPAATLLLGVFDGNPAGKGSGDPQLRDASGTTFNLRDSAFVIGEVQYAINQEENASGLPGTYKFGAWYNSDAFANQFDAADPGAAASPATYRGDWSLYAVVDQTVFRQPGSKDGGASIFARAMGAPGDRNQVDVFVDGGVSYKGAFGRDGDTMGFGVGWARIGTTAQAGDAALSEASGGVLPVRGSETVLEATYLAQLAPWWSVQPDFQYVFNPGGGILNPNGSGKRVGDAAILGLRTSITF